LYYTNAEGIRNSYDETRITIAEQVFHKYNITRGRLMFIKRQKQRNRGESFGNISYGTMKEAERLIRTCLMNSLYLHTPLKISGWRRYVQ
jgi:hypothetical protein